MLTTPTLAAAYDIGRARVALEWKTHSTPCDPRNGRHEHAHSAQCAQARADSRHKCRTGVAMRLRSFLNALQADRWEGGAPKTCPDTLPAKAWCRRQISPVLDVARRATLSAGDIGTPPEDHSGECTNVLRIVANDHERPDNKKAALGDFLLGFADYGESLRILVWCGRRDSNSHTLRRWNLNPVCLPIPPHPRIKLLKQRRQTINLAPF